MATLKPQAGIAAAPVGAQQPVRLHSFALLLPLVCLFIAINSFVAVYKLSNLCTSFQQYGMEAAGVPDQPIEEAGMTPEVIQKVSYLIFYCNCKYGSTGL